MGEEGPLHGGGDVHFHSIQLRFLRNHTNDIWLEQQVGGGELRAKTALDGGLDFGLGARGDAGAG